MFPLRNGRGERSAAGGGARSSSIAGAATGRVGSESGRGAADEASSRVAGGGVTGAMNETSPNGAGALIAGGDASTELLSPSPDGGATGGTAGPGSGRRGILEKLSFGTRDAGGVPDGVPGVAGEAGVRAPGAGSRDAGGVPGGVPGVRDAGGVRGVRGVGDGRPRGERRGDSSGDDGGGVPLLSRERTIDGLSWLAKSMGPESPGPALPFGDGGGSGSGGGDCGCFHIAKRSLSGALSWPA